MHEDNQEISAGHLGAYVDLYWGLAFDDAWVVEIKAKARG
jgi:hypothetical protein